MTRIKPWNVGWTQQARPGRWRALFNVEHDPMALKIESVEINCRDRKGRIFARVQISGLVLNAGEKR